MNLDSYYQERNKNQEWYDTYFKCGDGFDGSVFKCFGTNYRDLSSFEYYFKIFKNYVGIPRSQWQKKDSTGQEIAKQYVVNMVDSFLYMSQRKNNELIYYLSSRGQDFEKMIENDFSESEKKFLLFIYIMNSAFKKTPRYLLKRAWDVWETWNNAGFEDSYLIKEIKKFLTEQQERVLVDSIFNYDIVWLFSFYSETNFLRLFNIASDSEKSSLKEKTIDAYRQESKTDVLAWKYKSTNFQRPTLIDSLIIIFISKIIKDNSEDIGFNEFYNVLVENFAKVYTIDTNKVLKFIFDNENVFKVIFKNAISEEDDFTERYIPEYKISTRTTIPTEKIDTTSQEGIAKLEAVRMVLKKLAKDKSKYLCALHDLNSCTYFTSKEENKNYLEIHHLVPREFSYNFEDTIEFVENYVPLCPKCHRMIHKAVDRERIALINYLFSQRKIDLEKHNIKITLKDLYDYYKIDKNKL